MHLGLLCWAFPTCGALLTEMRPPCNIKTDESLFISLPITVTNSYCRSQFCHVHIAWSTILSTGWLRLCLQATAWAVAIRSLPQCCDLNPQKGQTCTQVYWKPFLQLYTHNWWAFIAWERERMATTAMSIDKWFRCSSGALSETQHCSVLRATYCKTFKQWRKVVHTGVGWPHT